VHSIGHDEPPIGIGCVEGYAVEATVCGNPADNTLLPELTLDSGTDTFLSQLADWQLRFNSAWVKDNWDDPHSDRIESLIDELDEFTAPSLQLREESLLYRLTHHREIKIARMREVTDANVSRISNAVEHPTDCLSVYAGVGGTAEELMWSACYLDRMADDLDSGRFWMQFRWSKYMFREFDGDPYGMDE